MNNNKQKNDEDWETLTHEAMPGYKAGFLLILSIILIYFIYIFVSGI
jgi:hypothetical protein